MHGRNNLGTITECFNTSTITGTNGNIRIGGITGFGLGGIVSNCYNAGSASGSGSHIYMGGIIGLMHMTSKIYSPVMLNCYNYGTITSATNTYVGSIVGANGVGSSYPAGTISNCYCTVGTKYSYNYYSGGMKTSTSGMVSADELKTYANIGEDGTSKLGSAYKNDTYGINNGYPVLTWQEGGFLEKQKIMASAYYDETEEKVFVDISYTKHGISKVITANGVELTKVDTNKYELANLNDITTTYKVIDNDGNEKELKLTGVYIIPDAQTLGTFRDEVNAGNSFEGITVIQIADINLNEGKYTIDESTGEAVFAEDAEQWTPIGTTSNGIYFKGIYNGLGHNISGIYINNSLSYQGVFGGIYNAKVKNIATKDGIINAKCYLGGIAGYAYYSEIINCSNSININGEETHIGGIVGLGSENSIVNSYNTHNISGQSYVGGICGSNGIEAGSVTNCYNTGTIEAETFMGGIVGGMGNSVTNCYNAGNVIGLGRGIGGIVGVSVLNIERCYNTGDVSGKEDVGGIYGDMSGYSTTYYLKNVYNTGNITGTESVGGIVGNSKNAEITDSYNVGNVTGTKYVAGILGFLYGDVTLTNNYNIGKILGDTRAGNGIIGYRQKNYIISNNYYLDTCTNMAEISGAVSKTEEELKQLTETLNNGENSWKSDIGINNGLPILSWQTEIDKLNLINGDNAYVPDTNNINNGYPILAWQAEKAE